MDVQDQPIDSGLRALITIARYHQLPAEEEQIRHQFGCPGNPFSATEVLRAAKSLGFKARMLTATLESLSNSTLPAVLLTKDGRFLVLARIAEKQEEKEQEALILDPAESQPRTVSVGDLSSFWSGELILITKRGGLLDSFKEFDIKWFIPALLKYRKLFAEVLLISFFLQLFALVTPLFFQVVMDKVLVHKGFTTLDVLAFGFVVVAIFDAILGGLRHYLFSHTTNRVDVELGAKLFNHLISLPLAYFEARQVGQSVARVRELETIRNFITGTALTLVIDLLFTIVFFAVMWYYSPTLTIIVLLTLPFYIGLSIFITPILRHRLDEKFKHGAENQAFLVESVTGVETLKAMSVEPQMQRRWEDQLSKYVTASFRT